MTAWHYDLFMIFIAGLLILTNGFFVGAVFEFDELICRHVMLPGASAEVLEVRGPRTLRIRMTLSEPPPEKTR